MSKIVTILAFYMLLLPFVPCTDTHTDCNGLHTDEITQIDNSHSDSHQDTCSPFCYCGCCGVQITELNFTFLDVPEFIKFYYPTKNLINRDFAFVSDFYGNIWTPPKINV